MPDEFGIRKVGKGALATCLPSITDGFEMVGTLSLCPPYDAMESAT